MAVTTGATAVLHRRTTRPLRPPRHPYPPRTGTWSGLLLDTLTQLRAQPAPAERRPKRPEVYPRCRTGPLSTERMRPCRRGVGSSVSSSRPRVQLVLETGEPVAEVA